MLSLLVGYFSYLLGAGAEDRRQIVAELDAVHNATQRTARQVAEQRRILEEEVGAGGGRAVAVAPSVIIRSTRAEPSPSAGPASSPAPDPLDPIAGPQARGIITMAVDRTEAAPGDTLTYTITLRNVDPVTHRFDVTSHIPTQTRFISSDACTGGTLSSEPGNVCLAGAEGRSGSHQIQYSRTLDSRGVDAFRVSVQIDASARDGSVITNHAHVQGPRVERQTSNETRSRVRLEPTP